MRGFLAATALLCGAAGGLWLTWPTLIWPTPAKLIFSEEQLNACAAEVALQHYLKDSPNLARAQESLALDGYSDILGTARAYEKRWPSMRTIYHTYAEGAPFVCIRHVAAGETIHMPNYGPRPGYHITKSPEGSGSVVKDGEPEPIFSCSSGYYASGRPWQPDGSGGCIKQR